MAHAKPRALVVDDVKMNRLILSRILHQLGYSVDHAADGLEAVMLVSNCLLQEQAYSLLLMDIMMPNLDGLEASMRIRALEAALSSRAANPAAYRHSYGADDESDPPPKRQCRAADAGSGSQRSAPDHASNHSRLEKADETTACSTDPEPQPSSRVPVLADPGRPRSDTAVLDPSAAPPGAAAAAGMAAQSGPRRAVIVAVTCSSDDDLWARPALSNCAVTSVRREAPWKLCGMDGLVAKPLQRAALQAVLQGLMASRVPAEHRCTAVSPPSTAVQSTKAADGAICAAGAVAGSPAGQPAPVSSSDSAASVAPLACGTCTAISVPV